MTASSLEERKDLVREAEDAAWNRGDLGAVDEMYAPEFVMHSPMGDRDRAETREMIEQVRAGSSDLEVRFDDLLVDGDRVVLRYTMSGTNTGPSFLTDEPTGESWEGTGISIYRIADGKIAEQWDNFDFLGVMRQLDLLPDSSSR